MEKYISSFTSLPTKSSPEKEGRSIHLACTVSLKEVNFVFEN